MNISFRDGSIYNRPSPTARATTSSPKSSRSSTGWWPKPTSPASKATGATIIADNGGAVVDPPAALAGLWLAGTLTPQLQPENNNRPYRIFGGSTTPVATGRAEFGQPAAGLPGLPGPDQRHPLGQERVQPRRPQRPWRHHRRRALRIDARRVRPEIRDAREQRARHPERRDPPVQAQQPEQGRHAFRVR